MNSKKAISPIIVTALLILVAASAIVGFQIWLDAFSSKTIYNSNEKNSMGDLQFKDITRDKLYIKSIRIRYETR